jgi:Fe-S cluster assembly iron-binding protein IscA
MIAAVKLSLTTAAQQAARRDLAPGQVLRIAFAGGCGAMGFRLSAARRGNDGDLPMEVDGVALRLDRRAHAELDGATLDYNDEEGFVLDHPAWGISC